jgi:hypothetical protein
VQVGAQQQPVRDVIGQRPGLRDDVGGLKHVVDETAADDAAPTVGLLQRRPERRLPATDANGANLITDRQAAERS